MTRLALLIALCVSLGACGEDANPTSPSSTSPSTLMLSGTVLDGIHWLPGATVTIMDGIHAGLTRDTDNTGSYSFFDLAPSSFTVQATATGYGAQNKAVNLTTANQSVNFDLSDH